MSIEGIGVLSFQAIFLKQWIPITRPMILLGAAIAALGVLAFVYSSGPVLLVGSVILVAFGEAALSPFINSEVARSASLSLRLQPFVYMLTFESIGGLIGTSAGTWFFSGVWVKGSLGWSLGFLLFGVALVSLLLIVSMQNIKNIPDRV